MDLRYHARSQISGYRRELQNLILVTAAYWYVFLIH